MPGQCPVPCPPDGALSLTQREVVEVDMEALQGRVLAELEELRRRQTIIEEAFRAVPKVWALGSRGLGNCVAGHPTRATFSLLTIV